MFKVLFKTILEMGIKCIILCIISLSFALATTLRHLTALTAKLFRHELVQPIDHHFTHLACQVYSEANVAIMVTATLKEKLHEEHVIQEFKKVFKNPEYNKLKQCIVPWCGYLFWKYEHNFCIADHIFILPFDSQPLPTLERELMLKPFPRGKSPWAVYVIKDVEGKENDALIVKMHHSLADGHSILKLLVNEICAEPPSSVILKVDKVQGGLNYAQEIWRGNIYPKLRAINWFANTICLQMVNPPNLTKPVLTSPMRSGLRKFHSVQSREIPLECVKRARKELGNVPFVGVILSGVTGALLKFVNTSKPTSTNLRVICVSPFPLPNHPGGMENHWSAILVPLTLGVEENSSGNLGERLRDRLMCGDLLMMQQLTGIFGTLPYQMVDASGFTDMIGIPLLVSDFPGPTKQISAFGTVLERIKFQVGFHRGNCGMMFFGTSYNEKWSIGLNIDEDVGSERDAHNIVENVVTAILSFGGM